MGLFIISSNPRAGLLRRQETMEVLPVLYCPNNKTFRKRRHAKLWSYGLNTFPWFWVIENMIWTILDSMICHLTYGRNSDKIGWTATMFHSGNSDVNSCNLWIKVQVKTTLWKMGGLHIFIMLPSGVLYMTIWIIPDVFTHYLPICLCCQQTNNGLQLLPSTPVVVLQTLRATLAGHQSGHRRTCAMRKNDGFVASQLS